MIASDIIAERKFGHTQVPIFMLAKDGKIVADDSALVRFEKAGERADPITGKPVADTTVYDYDATSEQTSEEDVLGGLGLGVDDYMPKPFSPHELSARVRRALARARS